MASPSQKEMRLNGLHISYGGPLNERMLENYRTLEDLDAANNNLSPDNPLASYHRGVAVRMLKDYLGDLETLRVGNLEHRGDIQKMTEYRTALEELVKANELDPNSPLTFDERMLVIRMLADYSRSMQVSQKNGADGAAEAEVRPGAPIEKTWMIKLEVAVDHSVGASQGGIHSMDPLFNTLGTNALSTWELCETLLKELGSLQSLVKVYHSQCLHLVDTLTNGFGGRFTDYRTLLHEAINGTTMKDIGLSDCRVVTFCVQSLVRLAHAYEKGVMLLSTCSRNEWWGTALMMSNVAPDYKQSRWSLFDNVLRQCEWSMDIVELAFLQLKQLMSTSSNQVSSAALKWSDEKCRLVLVRCSDSPSLQQSDSRGAMDAAKAREAEDIRSLLSECDLLIHEKGDKWPWHRKTGSAGLQQKVGAFLKQKLEGPSPNADYLPYNFNIGTGDLVRNEHLGMGSFGSVDKCKWLGEDVAVKFVKFQSRKDFEAEAAILARVQHPNVVQLLACSYQDEQTGLLIMELMDQDLRALIEYQKRSGIRGPTSAPFPLVVAIDIMLQIAEGMRYLKDNRILHRDLKARNILVKHCKPREKFKDSKALQNLAVAVEAEDQFWVKLADFGQAKHKNFGHTSQFHTRMRGTTPWRAPEVFQREDLDLPVDYRWPADVYSFGMVCYEILTGCEPFEGEQTTSIHKKIMSGIRPKMKEHEFPAPLTELIQKCWASKPEERPDFSEICKELWLCKVHHLGYKTSHV